MKLTALEELNTRLLSSGMDQDDVDHLLARFLEEEAYDYVDCMDVMKDMLVQYNILEFRDKCSMILSLLLSSMKYCQIS